MNMLLPDKFTRVMGPQVKVVVYDINPLREDYSFTPVLLSVLRDRARGSDLVIDYSDDVLNEATLTDKRIENALASTDADLLVFGSYVATRSNVQPMIHIICTYGRPMEEKNILPEGMELDQAIIDGDAILQIPRHVLLQEVMPVMAVESLAFQNSLAEDIFHIARFLQAMKLYKAERFKEVVQVVESILAQIAPTQEWPTFWVPFTYLHMLSGLAQLRLGDGQSAVYTLSNALLRSSPAKMRIQRCAESIISSLMQPPPATEGEAPAQEGGETPAAGQ